MVSVRVRIRPSSDCLQSLNSELVELGKNSPSGNMIQMSHQWEDTFYKGQAHTKASEFSNFCQEKTVQDGWPGEA